MEMHARDRVGGKKGGIHFAEMCSWRGGREGHSRRKEGTCSGEARCHGTGSRPFQLARWGRAGGELAQVGRSQGLQTLIEYLACARCCKYVHKALVMIYALRNSL